MEARGSSGLIGRVRRGALVPLAAVAFALLAVGGSSAAGGTDASFKVLELTSAGTPLTVFETADQLVAADTDSAVDVYMRVGATSGNTSLLSDRVQPGADADTPATFKALRLTSSGAPLTVFETAEPLVAGDTDGAVDVYMRVGATSGNTSLLSDRIQGGADAATNAGFKAIELTSSDSPLTVFETAEPLLADDGDGATDVYMRVGATSGNTSLLSDRIQGGADAAKTASFKAIELTSTDSPLTVFETAEPLLASDADGATDVYMRVGATSGDTSLLSDRIQPGADASKAASFKALELTSSDSPLSVFETAEPLVAADGDAATDVYLRVGATSGNTSLLSDRIQPGADAATNASFKAIELTSSNSPLTVFETTEPLVAADATCSNASATRTCTCASAPPERQHERCASGRRRTSPAAFRPTSCAYGRSGQAHPRRGPSSGPSSNSRSTALRTSGRAAPSGDDGTARVDVYMRAGATSGNTNLLSKHN